MTYILELLHKCLHLFQKDKKKYLEEFNEIETNKPDPVIKVFLKKLKSFGKIHRFK